MPSLSDDIKDQVRQSTDIVRLIGEQVALRPKGKEYIGLCPFHDDKNPSMYVSPVKQIYKCFSCGAAGDVFGFVMNYHKMTFPEALTHLAERAGIAIAQRGRQTKTDDGQPTDRQRLLQANQLALGFFQSLYRHSEHGRQVRDYVQKRKISEAMIQAFQLGYAPDRWDGLVTTIAQKQWDRRGFELAGLVSPRYRNTNNESAARNEQGKEEEKGGGKEGGDFYDRLRHRLIFPICDAIGRPIAFGGRKLRAEDEPKYLNSPETLLFNKSATLYGLHLAKKSIIDSRTAVIVEGYTDVIACHQAGITNVVATLGTALTSQHVSELRRYGEKVILIYDGDEAGIKASDRALEVFLREQLDVAIAVLPDDLDPAELFELPDGVGKWHAAMSGAQDALDYQFDRYRQKIDLADTITGRQKLAEEYLQKLADLGLGSAEPVTGHRGGGLGLVRQAMLIQKLASMLHLSESAIRQVLSANQRQTVNRSSPTPTIVTSSSAIDRMSPEVALGLSRHKMFALQLAERQLVGALLVNPTLFHRIQIDGTSLDEAVAPQDLLTPAAQRSYQLLHDRLADGRSVTLASFLADMAEQGGSEGSPGEGDEAEKPEGGLGGNLGIGGGWVIEAESMVQQACQDDAERLEQMAQGAAQSLVEFRREQQYRQQRQAASVILNQADADRQRAEQALRQIAEHQRAFPSARRVPRPPSSPPHSPSHSPP